MADAKAAFRGFPLGIEISIVLHVVVVAIIWAVLHFHGHGVSLPPVSNPFEHAIAVSITPVPKPQPKPKVIPTPAPPKPTPTPPVVQTQSVQPLQQAPLPQVKTPPTPPQREPQPEEQANPDYQQLAENILDQTKRYPKEAVLSGTEGEVTIQFVVNNQGTVLGYTIEKSSRSDVLDNEVKRMLHAARFPPFPPGDHDLRKTLDVTIEFRLGAGPGP